MAGKRYKLNFKFSDGTTKTVEFVAPQGPQGPKGATGATGKTPIKGTDYWTDSDKQEITEYSHAYIVNKLTEELAKRGQLKPEFANSIAQCTDTTKLYVLPDGYIYAYMYGSALQTVTKKITGVSGNQWESGRLGSGGAASAQAGYVITPYINLSEYPIPFKIHLGGIKFTGVTYNTCSQYTTGKAHIQRMDTTAGSFSTYWKNAAFTDNGGGTCEISISGTPTNKSNTTVGYVRFTGYGDQASADVYISYEAKTEGYAWGNTGIAFVSGRSSISANVFTLANPAVRSFTDSAGYSDSDYSYTQVADYAHSDYYRKDLPFPVTLDWDEEANAVEYTVAINTLKGVLNTGMQTYYTSDHKLPIYNLIPGTTYYYKVTALMADGTTRLLKDGSFATAADRTRMLNIEGIQNVRDLGGYTGANGKTVKYGRLYRGSGMDESAASGLYITDSGRQELLTRVGVRTDLDLRYNISESILGTGVYFKCIPYESYVNAISNATQRGYFKTILEYLVTQLTANKPVYIHCQGGCDRTGTLVFLLLGLLGVSESDLAKEYELSSFSAIGHKSRTRNSSTYNYKGLVTALKAYSGATIADQFYSFATTGCGIAADTITRFRGLMLE